MQMESYLMMKCTKKKKQTNVNITQGYNMYMTGSEKSKIAGKWTNMNILSTSVSEYMTSVLISWKVAELQRAC